MKTKNAIKSRRTTTEEKELAFAIKSVDVRLKNAESPREVEALELEMADLMGKLLLKMCTRKA